MDTMLRQTVMWYGDLGLLTVKVARNLALPPAYLRGWWCGRSRSWACARSGWP